MSNFTGDLLAEVVRAGVVESVHNGHLALINSDGSLRASVGDIQAPMYPRSSIKSFQAAAMVRNGLKLSPRQLAIVCASHSGAPEHFEVVESILSGAGNGWDTKTYLDPEHPLQIAIRQEIQTLIGGAVLSTTIDGCGAPLFVITTHNFAIGTHTMRVSQDPVYREVVAACLAHPDMVAGKGRLTTTLMNQIPGLFVKDGAEAVELLSLADGRACIFKVSDGSDRAFPAIVKAVLKAWDIDAEIDPVLVRGGSQVTGEIQVSELLSQL